ncbi:MAG: hypothetical protein NTX76_04075 [Alphaproteobacteria bacterium]|nr:hypothetical protein [Alphaproteobacteria bacterium]
MSVITSVFTSPQQISSARTVRLESCGNKLSKSMDSNGTEGKYSDLTDVKAFIKAESMVATLQQRKQDNAYLLEMQKHTTQQVASAETINNKLSSLIQGVRSNNPMPNGEFKNQIRQILGELTSVLNESFLGETTLAGAASLGNAVVDLSTLGGVMAGAGPDISYYVGGNKDIPFTIDENHQTVLFPINAADPAFEKTIRACRLCLSGDATNSADPLFGQAFDLCRDAQLQDYPSAVASVAAPAANLRDADSMNSILEQSTLERIQALGIDDPYDTLQKLLENNATLSISQDLVLQQYRKLTEFAEKTSRGR